MTPPPQGDGRHLSDTTLAGSLGHGFEAQLGKDVPDAACEAVGGRAAAGATSSSRGKRAPVGATDLLEAGDVVRPTSGLEQQPRKQLVVASGQRDVEAPTRAPVELGRAPGAPARSPRQASIFRTEKSRVDQLVKMKGGHGTADANGSRGLVAAHRRQLSPRQSCRGGVAGARAPSRAPGVDGGS